MLIVGAIVTSPSVLSLSPVVVYGTILMLTCVAPGGVILTPFYVVP
jgi:hypothetical protein